MMIVLGRFSPLGKIGSSLVTWEITPAREERRMSMATPMMVTKGESLDWVGMGRKFGRRSQRLSNSGYFRSLSDGSSAASLWAWV